MSATILERVEFCKPFNQDPDVKFVKLLHAWGHDFTGFKNQLTINFLLEHKTNLIVRIENFNHKFWTKTNTLLKKQST